MLDVLTDLKKFAANEGLEDLAGQIDACHQSAQAELCRHQDDASAAKGCDKE